MRILVLVGTTSVQVRSYVTFIGSQHVNPRSLQTVLLLNIFTTSNVGLAIALAKPAALKVPLPQARLPSPSPHFLFSDPHACLLALSGSVYLILVGMGVQCTPIITTTLEAEAGELPEPRA